MNTPGHLPTIHRIIFLFLTCWVFDTMAFAQSSDNDGIMIDVSPDVPAKHRLVVSAASSKNYDSTCLVNVKAYYKLDSDPERSTLLFSNLKLDVLRGEDETPELFIGQNELIEMGIPGLRYLGGEIVDFSCQPAKSSDPLLLPACDIGVDRTQVACGVGFQRLSTTVGDIGDYQNLVYSNNTLFASSWNGLYVSHDKGRNFVRIHDTRLTSVRVLGSSIYAVSDKQLYVSHDLGRTYALKNVIRGPYGFISDIFVDGTKIYVATQEGLAISTDGGNSFNFKTTLDGLADNRISDVFIRGSKVFVGTQGGLSISSDAGNTFVKAGDSRFAGRPIFSVTGDEQQLVVVTEGRSWQMEAALSIDDGGSFTTLDLKPDGSENRINNITIVGPNIFVAGTWGLRVSNNGGKTFTVRDLGLGSERASVVAVSGQTVFVGTSNQGLLVSEDGGRSFRYRSNSGYPGVKKLAVSQRKIYVATHGGVSVSEDQGENFSTVTMAQGLTSSKINDLFVEGSKVYITTKDGLFISEDDAATFKKVNVGNNISYPDFESVFARGQSIYLRYLSGILISNDAGRTFVFKPIIPSRSPLDPLKIFGVAADDQNIYVATEEGLAISGDGGDSFLFKDENRGLPSSSIEKVFVVGGNVYILCGGFGYKSFLVSKDHGETFQTLLRNIRDADVTGSRVVGVAHWGLTLSEDGGKTFTATAFDRPTDVSAFGSIIVISNEKQNVYSIKK